MEAFIWYLIGWLILSISHYVYLICIGREETLPDSKKLMAYKSFKVGILSWLGIIILIVILIVAEIFVIDSWIEEKLS